MANLKDWILGEANGEKIEAVVIGEMGWGDYSKEEIQQYDKQVRNKVLTWKKAAPMIDYEFDSGYGAPGCNAIVAWTKTKVISVSQYDGATGTFTIPRHPIDFVPEMPGG